MEKRTFYVDFAGVRGSEMRYRVGSALELFDACMQCRYRSYIKNITQHMRSHRTFIQLAVVEDASPEMLEMACAEAWDKWRPKSEL